MSSEGGEVTLFTPMTMIFLRINAIAGAGSDCVPLEIKNPKDLPQVRSTANRNGDVLSEGEM